MGCKQEPAAEILSEAKELMKSASTAVVVGAQWGDEGKGKIVDVLSENFPSWPAMPAATMPVTP